jgi:TetR/AcrR family transcriptional regulator, transcriptional repressor for nem operon
MKSDIKSHIIEKGAEVMYFRGYQNTGIHDILQAAEIPKGSFYYYFENKEDFGIQFIDYFLKKFLDSAEEYLSKTGGMYLLKLKKFLNSCLFYFENNSFRGGCPIANLSVEMSDLNENIRMKLESAFHQMEESICQFLEKALQNGELEGGTDIRSLSGLIINCWEGSLMRMKVDKRKNAMEYFNGYIFTKLLKAEE